MKLTTTSALWALLPLLAECQTSKPPVESEKLQALIGQDALMSNLQKLNDIAYANGGNRAFGLPGYDASVDFIVEEVSKLQGLTVRKQAFSATFTQTTKEESSVEDEDLRTVALIFSPSTPEEGVTLPLIHGPEGEEACDAAGYASAGINATGKIVLVERGVCPQDGSSFAQKLRAAAGAGAEAVLIYNLDEVQLTAGSLGSPSDAFVPCAIIDQEPGQRFKARLEAGEMLEAHVAIVQIIEERESHNIIAETKGGDAAHVVSLGAHLDSVDLGPGINDNGSGSSLLLELAKALESFSTKLKVQFAWWGAEETGLWGSRFFVNNLTESEIDSLLLYMNFDMVGRGYFGVFDGTGDQAAPGGPAGSEVIDKLLTESLQAQGKTTVPVGLIPGTDYVPFKDTLNKPVGGLWTGNSAAEDACYHRACDNITNPVPETLHVNAKAAAHALAVLATDGVELLAEATANSTTTGAVRRVRDEASLHVRDGAGIHGSMCDHGLL